MNKLKYHNSNIHYASQGNGKTVVLLHGFLENIMMWNDVSLELSKQYQVICIDLLGHGKTDSLGEVHTMEKQVEMIKFVLDFLNLNEYVFVGHSMGGYISLAFAEAYKKSIKGISLMNSSALADTDEVKANRDRSISAAKKFPATFVKLAIPNLFSEENKTKFSNEIKRVSDEALKISSEGIIAALQGMKIRKDYTHLYQTLQVPVQMIIGKKDPALDYDLLISQTKNTNVQVIEFPDGHMSYIENKKDLINSLKKFVDRCYA